MDVRTLIQYINESDLTTEQADPTDEAYYIETLGERSARIGLMKAEQRVEPAIADSESTKAMASVGDTRSKEEDTYGEGGQSTLSRRGGRP